MLWDRGNTVSEISSILRVLFKVSVKVAWIPISSYSSLLVLFTNFLPTLWGSFFSTKMEVVGSSEKSVFNSLRYCKLHGILWASGVNWLVKRSPDMSQDVNPFRARNLPVTYLICCTYLVRVFKIKKNKVACRIEFDKKKCYIPLYNSHTSFNLALIYCRQEDSIARYSKYIRHITQKQTFFLYLHIRYIARCFK
jgi:hypothetical protein